MSKNQLWFKQTAERMRIKLRGPVEHCPQKPNPNNFDDLGYENIWKIFVYFKCEIHNEGLPGGNCCFLAFFKTGSKVSSCQVSSSSDQPFWFFDQKCPNFKTFFYNIFFGQILVVFHHLKKVSPISVQKWACNNSLLFGTFDLLNFHCLTHSALQVVIWPRDQFHKCLIGCLLQA